MTFLVEARWGGRDWRQGDHSGGRHSDRGHREKAELGLCARVLAPTRPTPVPPALRPTASALVTSHLSPACALPHPSVRFPCCCQRDGPTSKPALVRSQQDLTDGPAAAGPRPARVESEALPAPGLPASPLSASASSPTSRDELLSPSAHGPSQWLLPSLVLLLPLSCQGSWGGGAPRPRSQG